MEEKNRFGRGVLTGIAGTLLVFLIVAGICLVEMKKNGVTVQAQSQTSSETEDYGVNDENVISKLALLQQYIDTFFLYDVDPDEVADALYRALFDSLGDRYSVYYDEEEFQELQESSEGAYYGIGVTVQQSAETGEITVTQVFSGSPAEEVGIQAGDVLKAVNDMSTEDQSLDEVVSWIRNEEGTKVKITVYRPSEDKNLDFTPECRNVSIDTVYWKMLDGDIGYLYLMEFDSVSPDQFATALEDLYSQGMKALILDLRSNPGGELESVVSIGNQLLPAGTILTINEKATGEEVYTSDGKNEIQIPLAVLVDGNTASAAEVLTGAIQDYGKGTIIGTQTFGKGIVQSVFSLKDGTGFKITTADYYTPSGRNIQGTGLTPDIVVEDDADTEDDEQLQAAIDCLTEKLK